MTSRSTNSSLEPQSSRLVGSHLAARHGWSKSLPGRWAFLFWHLPLEWASEFRLTSQRLDGMHQLRLEGNTFTMTFKQKIPTVWWSHILVVLGAIGAASTLPRVVKLLKRSLNFEMRTAQSSRRSTNWFGTECGRSGISFWNNHWVLSLSMNPRWLMWRSSLRKVSWSTWWWMVAWLAKKPYNKPSYYITSMIAAESMFSDLRCDKAHEHEHLEGSNKYGSRTKQASVWPSKLNQLVIDCIAQQADIEKTAASSVVEVFPAEVRHQPEQGGRRLKRRRGRVATLTGSAAPPVYIRPSQPDTPDPLQDAEEPEDVPDDDQGYQAQKTSSLEPILNENEGERRYLWLQVDADLRKLVRDLHVNFGHCTNVTLQRILRRQGAKIEAIKAAGLLSCDACGDSIRRRRPRPVKLPPRYQFNYHLMMDTFYARDGRGLQFAFLNIICEATSFQVVSCLGELSGPPSSQVVLRHFLTSWSSWAGLPNSIQVDRGKEFMARFADYLKNFNVEQEVMPLKAPWKGGKCERAGGLWKELWDKTVSECNIQGLEDALTATTIVTQTRNSFPRSNGYAPNQWVLGQPEVKLPASLLTSEPQEQLEVLEAAENPESAMARTLQIREAARVAQIRLDTSSRVRRALLRQSTPTRGPFPVGSYVYFFRRQQPSKVSASGKNYNWFGPARVIGVELRNPRRLEDPEDATEGTAPHSYWLRYGPSVVLCTGEQLRFASEDELLAAHYVPTFAVDPKGERGARNYVDLRHHTFGQLPDGTQISDAVNQDHWTSHSDGRVIRHHNVPRRDLFDPRDVLYLLNSSPLLARQKSFTPMREETMCSLTPSMTTGLLTLDKETFLPIGLERLSFGEGRGHLNFLQHLRDHLVLLDWVNLYLQYLKKKKNLRHPCQWIKSKGRVITS